MAISFPADPELSERDLATIRRLVYERSGIALHAGKGALVAARLQKRLRSGGFRSFREYVRFLQSDATGDEVMQLLDAIATNHTAFFREPQHFQFLRDVVLPPLAARDGAVRGWSAACATGEEAYTIAMILLARFGARGTHGVRLLASDISTKALAAARAGAYRRQTLDEVPRAALLQYFESAPELPAGAMRVKPEVRALVDFRRINLLDQSPAQTFDFIFCRNVMIYFDQPVQQRVVCELERCLAPGGYLFVSHSESLNPVRHDLKWVAPAVYQRVGR